MLPRPNYNSVFARCGEKFIMIIRVLSPSLPDPNSDLIFVAQVQILPWYHTSIYLSWRREACIAVRLVQSLGRRRKNTYCSCTPSLQCIVHFRNLLQVLFDCIEVKGRYRTFYARGPKFQTFVCCRKWRYYCLWILKGIFPLALAPRIS